MKTFFVFFVLFLSISFPALADTEFEANDPFPLEYYDTNTYIPGYCSMIYDVLASDNSIYTCTNVTSMFIYRNSAPPQTPEKGLRYFCWEKVFRNYYSSPLTFPGIVLDKQMISGFTVPPSYSRTKQCKLKKKADPDEAQVCSQPIDINRLVTAAFSNKFPLDLFTNFSVNPPSAACPSFTIRAQTFQLCYLNQLVAALKYVLLVIFIISSVIAL